MTDGAIVGIMAGIPLILAALGNLWVSMRNGAKADVIVGHVNSEKTASEGREITLKRENELLREMLDKEIKAASLLAQAAAIVAASPAKVPIVVMAAAPLATVTGADAGPSPTADASLQKIDKNTEATAKNTEKTTADVAALKEQA